MTRLTTGVLSLACTLWVCAPAWAQDGDRIWGRVRTTDGEVHDGWIRWDRNEASWVDILDGSKPVPSLHYAVWLAANGRERAVRTIELPGYRVSWNEEDPDFRSASSSGVRFGHLASLEPAGRDRARVTLKSGESLELSGGSTDIGTGIRELLVEVPGRRALDVDWDELERIDFSAPPAGVRAESPRLYGTVRDIEGRSFTGYISWDLDEVLASDVLDGEEIRGGRERDVRFGDVSAIEKIAGGARVRLRDGVVLELTGSNDVDDGHRGVQISDPRLGMVEVEWDELVDLRLIEAPEAVGYASFDGGGPLLGTVVTRSGEELRGVIRWDADESSSWELLSGMSEEVAFTVELGLVARIQRGEVFGATVTLLDGRSFTLDGVDDVSWDNNGVMVAAEDADPEQASSWRLVSWDDFAEVRFDVDAGAPGRERVP